MIEGLDLPQGYAVEWGPVALQEKQNEGRLAWLMAAATVFAYLFLVALFESWTVPISVMLSVLFAVAGAFLGLWLTGTQLSVYAQLGGDGRREPPLPRRADDGLELHHRRPPARLREIRRRRRNEGDRHLHDERHARLDPRRHRLRPRPLRPLPAPEGEVE